MTRERPQTIILTGASGFIGRHLIEVLRDEFVIYALARRTQKEVGIPHHENVRWVLVDITEEERLAKIFRKILDRTPVDFVIHLAAYYDFGDQVPSELYERTNVQATRSILELTRQCEVERFVFASSLVASNFPPPGDLVYEGSPLDACFPYALTKIEGESLCREYSRHFPCTVVRFAAVFSDWCEYEPLYHFLRRWLSDRWDARVMPGQGRMAIPYIHINCITELLRKILVEQERLSRFDVLLASSDRPVTHTEMFELATRLHFGKPRRPLFIPALLARAGVLARDLLGRIQGRRPFERMWMTRYIDKEFPTDCTQTRQQMDWWPRERHDLTRRLLHMIENLKSVPDEWHRRNLARVHRFAAPRTTLSLAQEMHHLHAPLVERIYRHIAAAKNAERYPYYQGLEAERLRWYIDRLYNNLLTSVRHGDRAILIAFGRDLARVRYSEGVALDELCAALDASRTIVTRGLYENPRLGHLKSLINDYIGLAIQLAIDEIQDTYDELDRIPRRPGSRPAITS